MFDSRIKQNKVNALTKIATHKLFKYGTRSLGLWIPPVFIQDNALAAREDVDVYRTKIDGRDALVLIPNGIEDNIINPEAKDVTEL